MKLIVDSPSKFSGAEKDNFKALVLKSGQVVSAGLDERIAKAHYIAAAMSGDSLVAIAAVKNNPARQEKYAKLSGITLPEEDFMGEFGWLYVSEDYRRNGYAEMVTIALILSAKPKGLFATIRASNVTARRFHESRGFMSAGKIWESESGDDLIMLYIRPKKA